MPCCAMSESSQSCRFVRSQNSTASFGSKPGFAISSGWKCHSQTTSVRSTASGQIWNVSM